MPLYDYACRCGAELEVARSFKETSAVLCQSCGEEMSRKISASTVHGHVRGTTIGKAYKESKVRRKRNAELGVKQLERYGGATKLVPNVGGEEVSSWREASLLAKEQGKDISGYAKHVEKEKNSSNSRGIDERAWKAAKEAARRA